MASKKKPFRSVHARLNSDQDNQAVATPDYILRYIEQLLGSNYFDPCPLGPSFDGLSVDWRKQTYVNPPYEDIEPWLQKAHHEVSIGNSEWVIFLIPFKPQLNFWDRSVFGRAHAVDVFSHPVGFPGYTNVIAWPMCLVHFRMDGRAGDVPSLNWLQIPGWISAHPGKTVRTLRRSHTGNSNK